MSEDHLISRAQDGDTEAFSQIVSMHLSYAYGVAINHLQGSCVDRDDVVQEAFISAWESIENFQPGRDFRKWLSSIIVYRCIDAYRKLKRWRVTFCHIEDQVFLPEDCSVDDSVWLNEIKKDIERYIETCDQRLSKIILLKYSGYTSSEISKKTGIPIGTVKDLFRKNKSKIRDFLLR